MQAYLARKKAHERVFQEVAIIADVKPADDIKEGEEDKEANEDASGTADDIIMEEPVGKRKTLVDEIMDTDLAAEVITECYDSNYVYRLIKSHIS